MESEIFLTLKKNKDTIFVQHIVQNYNLNIDAEIYNVFKKAGIITSNDEKVIIYAFGADNIFKIISIQHQSSLKAIYDLEELSKGFLKVLKNRDTFTDCISYDYNNFSFKTLKINVDKIPDVPDSYPPFDEIIYFNTFF
jgi:hypothetical protein